MSRGGPGGYGIGNDLKITLNEAGEWEITDLHQITLYSGDQSIPGEMIYGDGDEANMAFIAANIGDSLKDLDEDGDGELSMDELFDMK